MKGQRRKAVRHALDAYRAEARPQTPAAPVAPAPSPVAGTRRGRTRARVTLWTQRRALRSVHATLMSPAAAPLVAVAVVAVFAAVALGVLLGAALAGRGEEL